MRTVREIVEWAVYRDGETPRPTPEQLAQDVERWIRREDAERKAKAVPA